MPNVGGLPVAVQYVLIDNTHTAILIELDYPMCTLSIKGWVNLVRRENNLIFTAVLKSRIYW